MVLFRKYHKNENSNLIKINVGEDITVEEEGEFKEAENKIIRSETLKQTIVSSKWNYILEEKSKITIIDNEIITGGNIEANTNIISVLTLSNEKNIKTKESLITIADNKITREKREEKSNNLYGIYSYNTNAIFVQVSSKFDTDSKIEKIAFGSEDGKGKIMSDWDIEHVEVAAYIRSARFWSKYDTPKAVIRTDSEFAPPTAPQATLSITIPSTIQATAAAKTLNIGFIPKEVIVTNETYSPIIMTSPCAKFNILAIP